MAKTPKKEAPSFEAALKRLEQIVEQLETGSASLDDTMRMYAEGIELSKACLDRLSEAELQLKRLSKKADGTFELTDEKSDA